MYKTVKEALESKKNILVFGDIMIDRYIYGGVNRISPEAPVPVVKVNKKSCNPGGAGNVAVNIAGLNSNVKVVGFTGDDFSRDELLKSFNESGIELDSALWNRNTISKTRLISGQQQIARIDEEESFSISKEQEEKLKSKIDELDFSTFDGVVVSDYNKGVCTLDLTRLVINKAKDADIPVIVDPKGSNWDKYRGATIITPNLKELGDLVGAPIENSDKLIEEKGNEILKEYQLENLVVTRSEKGMSLINRNEVEHFPTYARDVFDVSGAGDTVVAGIIRFYTSNLKLKDSINIANFCAGIVVGHVGTWPITKEELYSKISDNSDLKITIDELKKKHKKIVFTNGCFDLMHPGHIDYLKKARELGDFLIVGLNSDDSVKRLKGDSRPVNNQDVRKVMLEALSSVDMVEIFNEDTPLNLIRSIAPDILVKGGDYKIEEIVGREFAKETTTIKFLDGFSTTSLIERIKKAYE